MKNLFLFLTLTILTIPIASIAQVSNFVSHATIGSGPNYLEIRSSQSRSALSQTRISNLQNTGNIISIDRVIINDVSDFLLNGHLIFEHPYNGELFDFQLDVLRDNTDYSTSLTVHHYSLFGYASDGSTIEMMINDQGAMGFIRFVDSDEVIKVVSLDDGEDFIIRLEPDRTVYKNDNDDCGTNHDEPLDPIYDDNYITTRCGESSVSILFLSTPGVTALQDPSLAADAIIAEMNMAASASGIDFAYTIAGSGAYDYPEFIQTTTNFTNQDNFLADFDQIRNSGTVEDLRDYHDADLVLVLVPAPYVDASGTTFGVAYRVGASKDEAYAIADITASTVGFTATHEIGHLLGARHNRTNICSGTDNSSDYHGFPIGPINTRVNQTILTTRACGLTRVARFSSETSLFMGLATGNEENRNAHIIQKCSNRASCFEKGVSPDLYNDPQEGYTGILGGHISDCQSTAEWTADIDVTFTDPVNYTWRWSTTGIGNWTYLGNQEVLTVTDLTIFPDNFYINVYVSDNNGLYGYAQKEIVRNYCFNDNENDVSARNNNYFIDKIIVFDIMGRTIFEGSNSSFLESKETLNNGVYVILKKYSNGTYETSKVYIN